MRSQEESPTRFNMKENKNKISSPVHYYFNHTDKQSRKVKTQKRENFRKILLFVLIPVVIFYPRQFALPDFPSVIYYSGARRVPKNAIGHGPKILNDRQSTRQLSTTIPDECAYRVCIRLVLDYSRPPATSKRGKRAYLI